MARDGVGNNQQIPRVVSEDQDERAARVGQDDFAPPPQNIRQRPREQQREIAPRDLAQQQADEQRGEGQGFVDRYASGPNNPGPKRNR
jgi:hypothetical protein